jgi:MFS family permease
MTTTAVESAPGAPVPGAGPHGPLYRFLFVHEIDVYPRAGRRTGYLALAVLATVVLYYTYYTQSGVTPNILRSYSMTFEFYVWVVIISNLIGAFGSLLAGVTDRLGRSNVVIYGLLIVGLLLDIGIPNAGSKWGFLIVISAMGLVEGAILVATPALVRDFSPQLGRATAMGFWTMGPVAGSLLVSVVAAHTLSHFTSADGWYSQFIFSGSAAIVMFLVSLVFLRDLSPRLRDQLMVSSRDRALLEARARGISDQELIEATRRPWRQIIKWDLVLPSLGIALFLLVYYCASSFFTIYWSTTFVNVNGSLYTVSQANGLNQWFWGAEIITLIIVGWLSDRILVRKPLMLVGAIGAMVFLVLFLSVSTTQTTGYDTLVAYSVGLAIFLSVTFTPWMAAYTESVEAKNPALVGTGLALWGWLLRLVVAASFIFLPVVVNAVNPIIDNQPVATPQIQAFLANHKASVAFATTHAALLQVVSEHQSVVDAVALDPSPANVVAAIHALGAANFAQAVKYKTQIATLVEPYRSQLNYLSAHESQLQSLTNGLAKSPREWQHWFWVCFGGMVLFVPTIFLTRGRWSPKQARRDKAAHEEAMGRELARLTAAEPVAPSGV